MRRLLYALLALALVAVGVSAARSEWIGSLSTPSHLKDSESEEEALSRMSAMRERVGALPVHSDPVLRKWMHEKIAQDASSNVATFILSLEQAFPHYLKLACVTSSGMTREKVLHDLEMWNEVLDPAMTHLAVALRPGPLGIGWLACVVTGQRLPDFTPEALADFHQTIFYSQCGICGHGQPCTIPRHTRSLSLQCPHCNRIYAILAADTQGRFRYMNEFLTGYQPPAHFPRKQSRLGELMTIWQAVAQQCRYVADTGTDDNDAWQTALETQTMASGDCEDTAILLTDWLLARGFQARVALGRYAERGGHAWVMVRLEGQDYLLESTEGASHARTPPLLANMGARYIPDMMFDRESFYTRVNTQQQWNGDYWNTQTWQRVVPRVHVNTAPAVTSAAAAP